MISFNLNSEHAIKKTNIVLCIIITILLFLVGCNQIDQDSTEYTESESPTTTDDSQEFLNHNDSLDECFLYGYDAHNEGKGSFIVSGKINLFNDWFYYINRGNLWKSDRSLNENILVFGNDFFNEFSINPAGYIVKTAKENTEQQYANPLPSIILNVNNDSVEETPLPQRSSNIIMYEDKIFLKDLEKISRIDMYDLQGRFIMTAYEGSVNSFAIVNRNIYFLPIHSNEERTKLNNVLMRYDIEDCVLEEVFEFEIKELFVNDEYYMPRVYYNNRHIIVENFVNSFIYTEINNIIPKEIVFDKKNVWIRYLPSDDEDLYFELVHDNADFEHTPSEFYKVENETTQPVLLKEFSCDGEPMFFSDGYLYYFSYESFYLMREKLFL